MSIEFTGWVFKAKVALRLMDSTATSLFQLATTKSRNTITNELDIKGGKGMIHTSDYCDYGHETKRAVRLDIGGGGGVYLCRSHWLAEMNWRLERNKELELENQFDILQFPDEYEN